MSTRIKGHVVEFNPATWWGKVCYDLTILDFHGTCVVGLTADYLPEVGDQVEVIMNSDGKLVSIVPFS